MRAIQLVKSASRGATAADMGIFIALSSTPADAYIRQSELLDEKPKRIEKVKKEIVKGVKMISTDFDKSIKYVSPKVYVEPNRIYDVDYIIRTFKDKNDPESRYMQVYMDVSYSRDNVDGWAFFKTASDTSARKFDLTQIDRTSERQGSGQYSYLRMEETIGIVLPYSYVREYLDTGLKFRVESQTEADFVLEVPPLYLNTVLSIAEPIELEIAKNGGAAPPTATASTDDVVKCQIGEHPPIDILRNQCDTVEGTIIN
jgi:hypothetical protein